MSTTYLATNIRLLRQKAKLTQDAVADACGVDRATVSKWESGEFAPRMEKLPLLTKLFKCSINRLFKEVNTNENGNG